MRFFFVAGCLRVRKGCLSGARFARNFFEQSFNSYLELEPPQRAFPQIPPPLGNASFDWISQKETKSTYEKQPFSEEKPQDRVNPLFSPNFRNEERKIIKEEVFVIAHFKLENRSMSCTFQLICIASLLAFSTFILVFMQNCRDCRFSNSEMTPMLPFNTRYDNAPGPLWPSNFQAKMLLFKVDFASAWYTIMHFKQKTHRIKPWKTAFYLNLTGHHDAIP